MGILRDWIVDTVAALCEEGATTLTIEALQEHALQPDQRIRLEMEARAGEKKIEAAKARCQQQLQELLGKNKKAQEFPADQTTSNGQQTADVLKVAGSPKSTSKIAKTKIERAASRDPVDSAVHEGKTAKCSFSGSVIEIPVGTMRDTGILKVECPECLCMRSPTPQGEVMRFPSHDPRKTRTPNREARWVKREGSMAVGWLTSATHQNLSLLVLLFSKSTFATN